MHRSGQRGHIVQQNLDQRLLGPCWSDCSVMNRSQDPNADHSVTLKNQAMADSCEALASVLSHWHPLRENQGYQQNRNRGGNARFLTI